MRTITLSAPGKNAMSSAVMQHIRDELQSAAGEPILITGANGAFSAGLNLVELASLDAAGMARYLGLLDAMVAELYAYPGPTVAALPGHAIAGGCVITLACDRRVMTDDPRARIGLNEVALGLRFPPVTWRAVHDRIPRQHHEEVLLGASLHAPQQALALGLVDELASDPLAVATERLARLASLHRGAYADTKRRMRGPVVVLPDHERVLFEKVDLPGWLSDETRAKIQSLLPRKG